MSDTIPAALRIRLRDPEYRGKADDAPVAGHWFLRPDPKRLDQEGWKLSFWQRGCEAWGSRRRLEGEGWEQASYVFASTFYDLTKPVWDQYLATLRPLELQYAGKLSRRKGFRPQALKKMITQAVNERKRWQQKMVRDAQKYMDYLVECGWPSVPIPTWPWDEQ